MSGLVFIFAAGVSDQDINLARATLPADEARAFDAVWPHYQAEAARQGMEAFEVHAFASAIHQLCSYVHGIKDSSRDWRASRGCDFDLKPKVMAQALLELSADNSGMNDCHYAAMMGDIATVRSCLAEGMTIDERSAEGHTSLHYAALGHAGPVGMESSGLSERLEVATLLLTRGASVDMLTHNGKSPLMLAADTGQLPLVELFLRDGASLHFRDKGAGRGTGLTAAGWAESHGFVRTVRVLEMVERADQKETPRGLALDQALEATLHLPHEKGPREKSAAEASAVPISLGAFSSSSSKWAGFMITLLMLLGFAGVGLALACAPMCGCYWLLTRNSRRQVPKALRARAKDDQSHSGEAMHHRRRSVDKEQRNTSATERAMLSKAAVAVKAAHKAETSAAKAAAAEVAHARRLAAKAEARSREVTAQASKAEARAANAEARAEAKARAAQAAASQATAEALAEAFAIEDVAAAAREDAVRAKEDADQAKIVAEMELLETRLGLKSPSKVSEDSTLCVVCIQEVKTHILLPCGHKCLCRVCATPYIQRNTSLTCPMCRENVQSVQRVFE